MPVISKTHTFSAGATIIASEHNTNFDTLYNAINGNIDNANISASAAIAATKLNLATVAQGVAFTGALDLSAATITEEVTMASANIVDGSANSLELGLVTPAPAKVTNLEATGTFKLGTTNQGDILYDNGTSIVRLTPGTDGYYLKTQGAAANPTWGQIVLPSFGSWTTATENSSTQATTDGFIIIVRGSSNAVITMKTDSSNPPTNTRIYLREDDGCGMCPVKKNDYYLIEGGVGVDFGQVQSYWLPFGS